MAQALQKLLEIRQSYGAEYTRIRVKLLKKLSSQSCDSAEELKVRHELCLFISAYPDSREVRALAEKNLKQLAREAKKFSKDLSQSGILNSSLVDNFTVDALSWLCATNSRDVEIDWQDEDVIEQLDEFLRSTLFDVEADAPLDSSLETAELLRRMKGSSSKSVLAWLLSEIKTRDFEPSIFDQLWEHLKFGIRWHIRKPSMSRTFARFPLGAEFFHRTSLRTSFDVKQLVAAKLPKPRKLSLSTKKVLLASCRAALYARGRETDPVTYANLDEISLYSLEGGVDVALLGLPPERRLPIESYIGFVAAKNHVPVAYGGAWPLGEHAEIGVNIFDTFRGGDSSFLFSNIMRTFAQHYGIKTFRIDPYQFGEDNREGLDSGAFWFYYKLGFRPCDQKIAALAKQEAERKATTLNYKSSRKTLKRLTDSALLFSLTPQTKWRGIEVAKLGIKIVKFEGDRFHGDRGAARDWAFKRALKILPVKGFKRWSKPERDAFKRMALLSALVPNLVKWSAKDKHALAMLMKAKGGPKEEDYVARIQRHAALQRDLLLLSK